MAKYLLVGSKSDAFRWEGQSWHCTSGLPSDVSVEIEDVSFHLHKFPLMSRSRLLEKLIIESSKEDGPPSVLQLPDIPGGAESFELVAKFCYGVKFKITVMNVVSLRCAAEHLQMDEAYGEGNLIAKTEGFLSHEVLDDWSDTIKALETCKRVQIHAEEVHIVSRCISSLAVKACAGVTGLFNWSVSGCDEADQSPVGDTLKSGISSSIAKKQQSKISDDWWYEDVSHLGLPIYKQFIQSVKSGGMKPENVSGCLIYYGKKHIPLLNTKPSFRNSCFKGDQRTLIEEIVGLLPNQRSATPIKFLLRLLRTAILLQASPSSQVYLEKLVGAQLDQASVEELLIPNAVGHSSDTFYDIDCFRRILDNYFVSMMDEVEDASDQCIVMGDQGQVSGEHSLSSMTKVGNLVDAHLAYVASDVNLKVEQFQLLAFAVPDYARPFSDGIYRAIDIYLKEHPWLADTEREQICSLMNCQKLSLEACTHAAQNERLPLRLIVQVLFFEQLRLRTSISGWLFLPDKLESLPADPNTSLDVCRTNASGQALGFSDRGGGGDDKECETVDSKIPVRKPTKQWRSWDLFCRRKSQECDSIEPKRRSLRPTLSSSDELQRYYDGELGISSLKLG